MSEIDPASRAPTLTARQPRAVQSALTVLEAVAAIGPGVTAREISEALGLPRATAYRLLNLLVQDEYLMRTPDLSGFALGARVAQLASAATPARLPAGARAIVATLRGALRGGVHVVSYAGGRIALVDADPDFPFAGEALLSREPERLAVGRLLQAEDSGGAAFARQVGELSATTGCLAVPIRDSGGVLIAAICFAGPRHRIDEPEPVLGALLQAARELEPYLG